MNPRIEQLSQIAKGPVWDGNLISKHNRDELVKSGFVDRHAGWNFLTKEGVILAVGLWILRA